MVKNYFKAPNTKEQGQIDQFIIDENHIQKPEDTIKGNVKKIDQNKYE
jgi:hypothetical protein